MKTFIKYLLSALIVMAAIFASLYFLLVPGQLKSFAYTDEQVVLIRKNGMVYDFIRAGRSSLMSAALEKDPENIRKMDQYLISDKDLPANTDFTAIYNVVAPLYDKGYEKEDVLKLVNNVELMDLMLLAENPLPVNKDVMFTALDKKYNVIQAYQLANLDKELSTLIINDGADYATTVKLNNKGYSVDDIKAMSKLSSSELRLVTLMKYMEFLPEMVRTQGFNMKLLPRYVINMNENGCLPEDSVMYVNDDLDYVALEDLDLYGMYSDDFRTINPSSYTALVNKNHYLNSDYAPTDLTEFSQEEMRTDVATALGSLFTALDNQGYDDIIVDIAYISYDEQDELFNRYLEMFDDDEEAALLRTPYACYSEHQTGLAVDFYYKGKNFSEYNGYQWLLD
ncbi:MAG: D-alanyl-D-alanine carboxypeptidase family protein, partial [Erysipelotrichaceae bacterium]|nr:D-alanyl-D-alanine carboxypeptidase family protein [Erysipelotrichaceae bacterium]